MYDRLKRLVKMILSRGRPLFFNISIKSRTVSRQRCLYAIIHYFFSFSQRLTLQHCFKFLPAFLRQKVLFTQSHQSLNHNQPIVSDLHTKGSFHSLNLAVIQEIQWDLRHTLVGVQQECGCQCRCQVCP